MATSLDENAAETQTPSSDIPDWQKATEGIRLFINNKTDEATRLFTENLGSLTVRSGYAYVVVMDAIMNFEDDKLALAHDVLKNLERECTAQSGWMKNMSKMFGYKQVQTESVADLLERQIILADSQILLGTLTFLQNDISDCEGGGSRSRGIFKGGWALRKAYKVYQRMFNEIKTIYEERVGALELPDPEGVFPQSALADDEKDELLDAEIASTNNGKADLDIPTIKRLMSAVSYGYGLVHLGVSLLPPSVLRLTQIFGFRVNRNTGLSCLMFTRMSDDMRAVLATLTLLWYHTIVRPFYCLDGNNLSAGADAAKVLLDESHQEYGESTLFLFFEGRMHRNNSDIDAALNAFKEAVDKATHREIRMLCLHEEGWCHIIKLDFKSARVVFMYLKSHSRWSTPFYCFIGLLCTGIEGVTDENIKQICDMKTTGRQKINQKSNSLCDYLSKRLTFFDKEMSVITTYKPVFFKMMLYEMIYLWNALPSCSIESLDTIIQDLEPVVSGNKTEEPMDGLKHLILGTCYVIKRDLDKGIENLRACVDIRRNKSCNGFDLHITAYSQYELGSLLIKNPETKAEGKTLLQEVLKLHNYDFDSKLSVKTNTLLKHL